MMSGLVPLNKITQSHPGSWPKLRQRFVGEQYNQRAIRRFERSSCALSDFSGTSVGVLTVLRLVDLHAALELFLD